MTNHWIKICIGGFALMVIGNQFCFTPSEKSTSFIEKESIITLSVEITSYNADPAQTDSTPTITASGQKVAEDICALSRDIEKEFGLKFGDIVYIEGYGSFRFQDRMNKRIKRGVDIFRFHRKEALEIGRRAGNITFTPNLISNNIKREG